MKNFLLLVLLINATISASSQSQERSFAVSNYRVNISEYRFIHGTPELTEYEQGCTLLNLGFGYFYPVYKLDPNVGMGINGTLQGGIRFIPNGDNNITADFGLPVTAALRVGSGSTNEAYWPVGIGLGAGLRLSSLIFMDGELYFGKPDRHAELFCRPYFYSELVFDFQKRHKSFFDNFKIQLAVQPRYRKRTFDSQGLQITTDMYTYFISFIKFNTLD